MKLSYKGLLFLKNQEGFVAKAYPDIGGVLTIGYGFTMRSKAFARLWKESHGGRSLRRGDIITRRDADDLLGKVADEEFGTAVTKYIKPTSQHGYDGAVSVAYNLGPASVKWRWGAALAKGEVPLCARLLRNGYNTVGGKSVPGLVRRRTREASLIQHGIYTGDSHDYYEDLYLIKLAKLGYSNGSESAKQGFSNSISAKDSIRAFQTAHVDLQVDGILGPATKAQIDRSLNLNTRVPVAATGSTVVGAGAVAITSVDSAQQFLEPIKTVLPLLQTGGALAALLIVAFVMWRYRTEIRMRIRKWFE